MDKGRCVVHCRTSLIDGGVILWYPPYDIACTQMQVSNDVGAVTLLWGRFIEARSRGTARRGPLLDSLKSVWEIWRQFLAMGIKQAKSVLSVA